MSERLSGFASELTAQQLQLYEAFDQATGRCMNWAGEIGKFKSMTFEDNSNKNAALQRGIPNYAFRVESPSSLIRKNEFGLTEVHEVTGVLFVSLLYLSHSFRAVQGIFSDEGAYLEVPLSDDPDKFTTAFKEAEIPQEEIDIYGANGLALGRRMLFKTLVPDGDDHMAFGEIGNEDEFVATKIPGVNWNMYIVDGKREHAIRIDKDIQFPQ